MAGEKKVSTADKFWSRIEKRCKELNNVAGTSEQRPSKRRKTSHSRDRDKKKTRRDHTKNKIRSSREKRTAKWILSLPDKSKQNLSPERLNISHSRGRKSEKRKRSTDRKTASPDEGNNVAGTSQQRPSKRRKTSHSRDRDKKKTRRDHTKNRTRPSRHRKDEKKDNSFCVIL